MYAGKVELCGVDTARLPVLSEAEKSRLIKAARAGDRQARQEMVQGNLRLVLSVVQRFAGRGENMDDLFQVGCIGLIKAIDNFDPAQNVRFSTYGVPMIVGEVKRYLRDNNAVRVSRSIRDLAYHSMQAREELQKQNGREPKLSEIAARVGQSPENVAMALESAVTPTSLYEPVYSDGEDSFALLDQLRDATGEESWISDMMFRDTVYGLIGVKGGHNFQAVFCKTAVAQQRPSQFAGSNEHRLCSVVIAQKLLNVGNQILPQISHLGPAAVRNQGQVLADLNLPHAQRSRQCGGGNVGRSVFRQRLQIGQVAGKPFQYRFGYFLRFHGLSPLFSS